MQIRQLDLTELDTAFGVVRELRSDLDYDAYEDLVYAMRRQEYKIYGIFEGEQLITYAGVSVAVTLEWKRHLCVHDLVTRATHRSRGYGREMLAYLADTARMFGCGCIILPADNGETGTRRFCEREGFVSGPQCFIRSF